MKVSSSSVLPEWTKVASLNLSEEEKKDLLEFCEFQELCCTCADSAHFCDLCGLVLKSPESLIFLDKSREKIVGVRSVLATATFQKIKAYNSFVRALKQIKWAEPGGNLPVDLRPPT